MLHYLRHNTKLKSYSYQLIKKKRNKSIKGKLKVESIRTNRKVKNKFLHPAHICCAVFGSIESVVKQDRKKVLKNSNTIDPNVFVTFFTYSLSKNEMR